MERATFGEERGTGGAMDGVVDAAAAEKGFVGCVHDTGCLEGGDVSADEGDDGVVGFGWLVSCCSCVVGGCEGLIGVK